MINILSYQNRIFSGETILNWAIFQIKNHTSKEKLANQLIYYYQDSIKPNRFYIVRLYNKRNYLDRVQENRVRLIRVRS